MNGNATRNYGRWKKVAAISLLILASSVFLSFKVMAYTLTSPVGTETNITTLTPVSDQIDVTIYNESMVWVDNRNRLSHPWISDLYSYNPITGNESLIRAPGDISEPSYPKIDRHKMVWQSVNTSTTYDIRLYDMLTNEYTIAAVNLRGDTKSEGPRPEISGDNIVWREQIDFNLYNIWLHQFSSKNTTLIASDVPGAPLPKVSGNRVVWQTFNSDSGLYDIVLYNISENPESPVILISGLFELPPMPAIDGNMLVWQAFNLSQVDPFFDIFFISDLSLGSTPQLAVSDVFPQFDPTPNPILSVGNIIWQDMRNGNLDIYMYNISRDELMQITLDQSDQRDPAISGNRIVWVDLRNGVRSDVFMYTLGTTEICPVAEFDTNATVGDAPFDVQFIDLSNPPPDRWTWEFGDGNSSRGLAPINYTYLSLGTYTVNLTVSTEYCRNGVSNLNLIHVGTPPEAGFNATPRSGFVPLSVNFTDESFGFPTEWLWDFGDGSPPSNDQHPTHVFSIGGSYNITLIVNNTFGSNYVKKIHYISVLNRTGTVVSTNINGLTINSNQIATFTSSGFSDFSLTNGNTTLWFIPPPENGISEMTLFADEGFTNTGGILTGNLTRVMFHSEIIPLEGFSPEIGTHCSLSYVLNLSAYPVDAQVTIAKWEGYIPSDYEYFLQTIYHAGFAGIIGVAYEVQFQKTNLNLPHNATLFLNVNSTWVEIHGTRNRIWILRISDDMAAEVLPTTYSHKDVTTNLDYFVADSPLGLSKFVLTGLHGSGNPLQLIVLTAQQWLGGDGGGDGDGGVPIVTATPRRVPSPSTIIPETVPAPEPTSTPESLEQVTIEAPIPTPTLPVIESPPSPVPTTTTPLPPSIPFIALVATAGVLWLVKRRK